MTMSDDGARRVRVAVQMRSFVIGGAEAVAANVANGLADLGFDVELFVLVDQGDGRYALRPSVSVVRWPWDPSRKRWTQKVEMTERYLREHDPDVFIANATEISQVAHKRAASRSKLVVVNHGSLRPKTLWNLIKRFSYHNMLEYLANDRPSAAVGVSRGLTENCMSEYAPEIPRTIYDPVITPERRAMAGAPLEHKWLKGHGQNERPVVVTVGRLDLASKGYDVLLRAFKKVLQDIDARLVIVGPNEGRGEAVLNKLAADLGISDKVDLAGPQDNPFPYMERADLFALSSNYEGFGLVLVEALFCGTPVVSTDCPHGPREILDDGKLGELVPVGDVDAMASAIVRALKDPPSEERRAELRARAEQFDDMTAARKYAELIEELVGPSSPKK